MLKYPTQYQTEASSAICRNDDTDLTGEGAGQDYITFCARSIISVLYTVSNIVIQSPCKAIPTRIEGLNKKHECCEQPLHAYVIPQCWTLSVPGTRRGCSCANSILFICAARAFSCQDTRLCYLWEQHPDGSSLANEVAAPASSLSHGLDTMPAALLNRVPSGDKGRLVSDELPGFHAHHHAYHGHNTGEEAHDSSIVEYENEFERLNSEMQVAWSEVMDDDYYTSSSNYEHVEVLMLSWEKEVDDLKVQQEIEDLTAVFQDTYNYHVTHKTIKRREKKKAQTQINAIVASWVDEYDGLKTLLVVYFAGHGKPGHHNGELMINGYQSSPSDVRRYLNTVVWNITENNLHEIQSDVLQIFDCCYAGTLATRGISQQSFEYLAATAADDTTASPGKTSFTSALIWALKELAKDSSARFTTVHLLGKIQEAPNFPDDQKPILSKRRENPANERIILHPLKQGSPVDGALNPNGTVRRNAPQQDVLTLKFVFESRPSVDDIRHLGSDLNHVVRQHQLHVNRIMWGGIQPRDNDMVFKAISNLKALRWRNKSIKHELNAGVGNGQPYHHPSKAAEVAARFVENLQEEVEEHVHEQMSEQIHEQVQEEMQREKEEWVAHQAYKGLLKQGTDLSISANLEE